MIALVVTFVAVCPQTETRPESFVRWQLSLQKLAASFRPKETDVQNKRTTVELIEAIDESTDGVWVEFKSRIKEVKWKEGSATIKTLYEIKSANPTARAPLKLNRSQPFEFAMKEVEASSIRVGDWITIRCKLEFHPRRWGAVGRATHSQQLWDIRYPDLTNIYLGTFTTSEYACTIKRQEFKGTWQRLASNAQGPADNQKGADANVK